LTEIERHEGIVFLATNRPHDLDEAMHRRITSLVQFSPPDYNMRLRIWESLLVKPSESEAGTDVAESSGRTSNRIKVTAEVDLSTLAIKYELTGGFIKNALLSAMLIALNRRRNEATLSTSFDTPVVLTQPDLEEGCRLQMRGSLSIRHFDAKVS
jgi:SpoVK/Ycf46/Vps4 family AAA+-type ATPase